VSQNRLYFWHILFGVLCFQCARYSSIVFYLVVFLIGKVFFAVSAFAFAKGVMAGFFRVVRGP